MEAASALKQEGEAATSDLKEHAKQSRDTVQM